MGRWSEVIEPEKMPIVNTFTSADGTAVVTVRRILGNIVKISIVELAYNAYDTIENDYICEIWNVNLRTSIEGDGYRFEGRDLLGAINEMFYGDFS